MRLAQAIFLLFTPWPAVNENAMNKIIVDRIAVKLVLWLVLFSSTLTLVGTCWQLYIDYTDDLERMAATVDAVTMDQIPAVRRSVLAGDASSVESLLLNLVNNSGLAYAAVIVDDKVTWQHGEKLPGRHVSSRFPLQTVDGGDHRSGCLEVMADAQPVRQELVRRFVQILFANGIKIFLIAGFVMLMFQYLVTRHLESLALQVRNLDFSKPYSPVRLGKAGTDNLYEIDQVVSGLNAMQEKAREAFSALARNEQRLLLFFDSTEEAIIGVDWDGICSFANDACMELLGLSEYEAVIGKELHDLIVHSRDLPDGEISDECIVFQSMTLGRALQCEDGCLLTPAGNKLFVSVRSYPVIKGGEVTGAIVFINDTSETRQLRRERQLLSEAVRQAPVLIVIADKNNLIQYVNPGTEQITGFSHQELIGRFLFQFDGGPMDKKLNFADIEHLLQAGQQWEGIIETRSKWGAPLKFCSVISPVFDDKNRVVNTIAVSREVSYEIALQDELVNAKKMEAVGRLSASFAHEFGNPLFGVRSVLRDVCERLQFSAEDQRLMELAYSECERMRDMVREFQQVYRDSTGEEELQSIDAIIRMVLNDVNFLRQAAEVALFLDLAKESSEIVASKNKLSLVLRNIIVNGVEAMKGSGGRLEIGCRTEGDFFLICIADTGSGIKKEHLEFIFEPFFSTKTAVEGTGLGLSIAYGTMKCLGGTITVDSQWGRGSSFTVHLPMK